MPFSPTTIILNRVWIWKRLNAFTVFRDMLRNKLQATVFTGWFRLIRACIEKNNQNAYRMRFIFRKGGIRQALKAKHLLNNSIHIVGCSALHFIHAQLGFMDIYSYHCKKTHKNVPPNTKLCFLFAKPISCNFMLGQLYNSQSLATNVL